MEVNPVQVAQLLTSIPPTLQAIRNLVSQTKDEQLRHCLDSELAKLQETIIAYAQMHYDLEEWKNFHDNLQRVDRSAEKLEVEVIERPVSKIDWEKVEWVWRSFLMNPLRELQGFGQSVKYIGVELDLSSPIQPRRKVNWLSEFQNAASNIQREVDAKNSPERLRENVDVFVCLIRDSMVAANSQLKYLAGTLAESSKRLEGALKGI